MPRAASKTATKAKPKKKKTTRKTRGRNVKQSVRAVARQVKALELRKAGDTYQAIANQLGYAGPAGAYKAVMSGLKAVLKEPAEELRTLELQRLDRLYRAMYPKAIEGNEYAVDRCLKISERRAKLLGLDAAKELEGELRVTFDVQYGNPDDPAQDPTPSPPLLPAPDPK